MVTVYILVVIIRYLAHDTSPYFLDDTDGLCILCVLCILLTTLTVIVFERKHDMVTGLQNKLITVTTYILSC